MGFVKVVKNKAYFKRFQVQYRRRREGKTDYKARTRLINQDKNKYNSPKYRFVVRITNSDVICQIIYAKIVGDVIVTAAYAHELTRYGLPVGHTNYAAAYATGLLCARRHLTKLGLARKYKGLPEASGEDHQVEPLKVGPRPFLALLDIGLGRTTTGSRIFAALKGGLDGGINIPHSEKRFFGYSRENKKLDAAKLRKVIFGGHVADYMSTLSKEEPDRYKKQFSRYIKAGIAPNGLEALIKQVHQKIRENPAAVPTQKKKPEKQRRYQKSKLSRNERKARAAQKMAALRKAKQ